MVLTRRLWTLLAFPPLEHPLYRQAATPRPAPAWWAQFQRVVGPVIPLAYLIFWMLACCASTSRSVGILVFAGVVGVILFNGTLFAARWSASIAAELAEQRQDGWWELVCLLPQGGLGAAWAVASGCMHRDNAFRSRYTRHLSVLRAYLIIVGIVSIGALMDNRSNVKPDALIAFGYVLGAALASYVDYVQSVVLGTLTALWAGIVSAQRFDAQAGAVGGFLALQFAAYAGVALLGLVGFPALLQVAGVQATVRDALLLALRLASFILIRELMIRGLWRLVAERLNTNLRQLDGLMRPALSG